MRIAFQEKIKAYLEAEKPIIYVDESGFAVDMPRTFGYSLVGKRCYDKKNWNAKGRTNAIGALLGSKLICVCLFESYINAKIFEEWVKSQLIPCAPKQAVIVMDNASFHKNQKIKTAIQKAGLTLEFLPPYSPDLNPIERKWAQAKAIRRRKEQSIDKLFADNDI